MVKKTARQLRLGDRVKLSDNAAHMTATVSCINGDLIHMFRPYTVVQPLTGNVGDSEGRLLASVAVETFPVMRDSDRTYEVLESGR